jgi:ZIP family zinc transporter
VQINLEIILLSIATFFSTLIGGFISMKNKDRLHKIMGFTAGVLLGVVFFDVLPEIFELVKEKDLNSMHAMIALVFGIMFFHIIEKTILLHHSHEDEYADHKHPHVGMLSALALAGHSFMDGVGIGLGFQINPTVGLLVAIAVIAHDFTDGMNTVSLVLIHKNSDKRAFYFLLLDAIVPVLGVASTLLFKLPESFLLLYLGFFAGFLLYIGLGDILPEAHTKHSSLKTIGLTILGIVFIFLITRFV